jgi:hypothetical protein
MVNRQWSIAVLLLAIGLGAQAKSTTPPAPQREAAPAAPVISAEAQWAERLLIGVAALFVAAALIGPLYRLNLPDSLPPTHSHDEPPGASHRHGPSGTVDYSAPDRH